MWTIILIFSSILALGVFMIWPKSGLYALAFSLPLIGWSFSIGSLIFPLIDLLASLVLAAFVLNSIWSFFFHPAKKISLKLPIFFPFFIFLLINLLSALVSVDPGYSLWYILRWPLFLYLAYIFLPYNLITDGKVLKKTIIALVLSSLVVLLSGYWSLYGQDWRDSFFRIRTVSWFGVSPFGDNHNLLAEFLNVGAFSIIMLRVLTKRPRLRTALDIFFGLTVLGIILTFSRAGWVTLLLQSIIYGWYYFRSKNYRPASIIISVAVILLILSPLVWKMDQLQQDNTSSTENRWLLTDIAWQAFQAKPYLGYGSGQFINLVDDNIRFTAKYGAPLDSHGVLQKVLAENGIFGLAAWLFILIYLLQAAYQALKKYYHTTPWLLPLFLAGGGGLFFQFFNTSYYKGKVWLPIAAGLAAIRLLENKYGKKPNWQD